MTTETWDPSAWENALIEDMRAHGGRPSQGPLAGDPLLLLYTTGARTGEPRRSILTYSRDGDAYVVAGTAGGSPITPNWVANVAANPSCEVEIGAASMPMTAEVLREGAERDRLWAQHVERLPWFGDYPAQVGGRTIPVIRLRRA